MLKKVLFDEFVRLNRGFDLPDSKMILGEYPVVASTNIKGYHNEYKVNPPVVVTGRSGSLGKVQYISEKCWPLNTSLYSKDFRGNNPYYVYLFLQTMHLEQYNAGVGVPTLNQNHLHGLRIYIHNKPDQQKIVDILSKYDRLIETNNKRIKVLEQMAEELYKEWFVRFRFPGYETAEFENDIPKRWSIEKLGDYSKISTGKNNRQDAEENGEYPFFDRSQDVKRSNIWLKDCEGIIVPGEGTSFIPRYYVGKFDLHQRCYCIEPCNRDIGKYLFYMIKMNRQYFLSVATGATVYSLRLKNFTSMKFVMPSMDVCKRFNDIVSLMFKQIESLRNNNENLVKQRDLLLPRLMSGKLEV